MGHKESIGVASKMMRGMSEEHSLESPRGFLKQSSNILPEDVHNVTGIKFTKQLNSPVDGDDSLYQNQPTFDNPTINSHKRYPMSTKAGSFGKT